MCSTVYYISSLYSYWNTNGNDHNRNFNDGNPNTSVVLLAWNSLFVCSRLLMYNYVLVLFVLGLNFKQRIVAKAIVFQTKLLEQCFVNCIPKFSNTILQVVYLSCKPTIKIFWSRAIYILKIPIHFLHVQLGR